MSDLPPRFSAKLTFTLILLSMVGTVLGLRLYLHLIGVRHVYPGGFLVHHLFTGILVLIPAAFVLAFGARTRRSGMLARVALGIGSGLALDEMTFLVMTAASDNDYVSRVSLLGSAGFTALAALLLAILYHRQRPKP